MDANHIARNTRTASLRRSLLALLLATLAMPALAQQAPAEATAYDVATPAMGDVDTASEALKPGEYLWTPERGGAGQLIVVVSLPAQRAHVYRNGVRIGISTVSTGTASHPTPTGTFEILQKKQMNYSNLYNNAPMPYMQRLTWDGIALHAGKIPGYPASHGCVRLPLEFAKILYGETQKGMLVVIADDLSHGPEVLYPGDTSPVDTYTGAVLEGTGGARVATSAP